jgi:hypothetical protein
MRWRCVAFFFKAMRLYRGKIFAGCVYNNTNARDDTTMRCFFPKQCVCIFVKYLQDGFTIIQTHAMTRRRCVAFLFKAMRLYRGKIFARWVYNNTNARDDTTMRCFFSKPCVCIFVKYLQDGFTKIQTHAMTWRRHALLFSSKPCVCIEVKSLQDGFTIIQTHAMTWRRHALLFFKAMRLYLCKIFARWVYNNTNARDDTTTSCVAFFQSNAFV